MCQFNYIALPPEADVAAVRKIARTFGKQLEAVSDHALLQFLKSGETLYGTATTGCDCGSCVGCGARAPVSSRQSLERESRKLAAKGWSKAKIARWMADKQAVAHREDALRHERLKDRMSEARAWCDFLRSALPLATPWIGLIHTWEGAGNSKLKKEFAETITKLDRLDEFDVFELPRFQLRRYVL